MTSKRQRKPRGVDADLWDHVLRLRETGEAKKPIREERYKPAYNEAYLQARGVFYGHRKVDDPTAFSTRRGVLTMNDNAVARRREKGEPVYIEDTIPK